MKNFRLSLLLILAFFVSSIPKAHADAEDYTIVFNTTPTWTNTDAVLQANSTYDPRDMTAVNGLFYTVCRNEQIIFRIGPNQNLATFNSGYTSSKLGSAIAADDAGNIIVHAGETWYNSPTKFAIYPAGATSNANKIEFRLGSYAPGGRCDNMTASGNVTSATGGYIWLCPSGKTEIHGILIQEGKATGEIILDHSAFITSNGAGVNNNSQTLATLVDTNTLLLQIKSTGSYLITFSGNEIISCKKFDDTTYQTQNLNNTICTLQGHQVRIVYSSKVEKDQDIAFDVIDLTDGITLASEVRLLNSTTLTGQSGMGALVHAIKVDDNNVDLYVYARKTGFGVYRITAKEKSTTVSNITTTIETNEVDAVGRQDATISWTAPATTDAVAQYKIYYQNSYINNEGVATTTDWKVLGTTTETSIVHKNVKWHQSGSYYAEQTYTYKVEPEYVNGEIGKNAISAPATPNFIAIAPQWDIINNYAGYCKVQLKWKNTSYGVTPVTYNVYRNGEVIKDNIVAVVFVDQELMSEQTYDYQIEAVYPLPLGDETAISEIHTETTAKRDWAKPTYKITEIYNYPIMDLPITADYDNFDDRNSYRQGVYHNGYWYIAQRSSVTLEYDEKLGATYDREIAAGGTGGIIKIPADNDKIKTESGVKLTLPTGGDIIYNQNVGIAVDDASNFFVKALTKDYNNATTTTYKQRNNYGYLLDGGIIYNSDFSKAYTVDLSGINFAANGYQGNDASVIGRADYYCMEGNVLSEEGGYLYIAPTRTKSSYRIHLRLSGDNVVVNSYTSLDLTGSNQSSGTAFQVNNENYAFPVVCEGRTGEEYIHNLRSNVYANISGTTSQYIGTVYDTHSRVNNSGGCTLEFNGELFVITPHSQYSINTGSFYVGMGSRFETDPVTGETYSVGAAKADLTKIIPACDYWQDGDQYSLGSNASSVWLHAELPDLATEPEADVTGDGKPDYAYIYMYVPGTRIAKYKLEPSSIFPPTQVELAIEPQYGSLTSSKIDNAQNEDLKQYDATVTWSDVEDYGTTVDESGNAFYAIEGYTVELIDEDGNPVPIPDGVPEDLLVYEDGVAVAMTFDVDLYEEDGINPDAVTFGEYGEIYYKGTLVPGLTYTTYEKDGETYHSYSFVYPNVDAIDDDGNKRDFTAYVKVNYVGTDESNAGTSQSSTKTEYENTNGYTAVAPSGSVTVYDGPQQWADWNGDKEGEPTEKKDPNDGYWDTYRVEIDIEKPDSEEPVSYYVVTYTKPDGSTGTIIVDAETLVGGDAPFEGYEDGTGAGTVPGTYDFDNKEKAADDSKENSVISFYVSDYVGNVNPDESVYDDEHPNPDDGDNDPTSWTYTITAVYAGSNPDITQSAAYEINTDDIQHETTGVENIEATSRFIHIYPIPASTAITINAGEAIDTVAIYTVAGVEVKAVSGNGATSLTVAVDNLAAGWYLLKVNNSNPVKIAVK